MKVIKKVIILVVLIILSIGLLIIGNGYDMYKNALEEMPLDQKIANIKEKENYIELENVPKMYIDAVICVEDHRFYKHNGIDIIAIGRAFVNDVKALRLVEGGSTITQQLSKNIYFTQDKNFTRKIAEVFMAFKIEKNYEKKEILELYINTLYFGDGYNNLEEACEGYFNKSLDKISDGEAILLAGIPNAPSVYVPTKNPELAQKRQTQIIYKMIKYKYITKDKAEELLTEACN